MNGMVWVCVCVVCAYACDRENGPAGGGKASQIALSKADNVNPLCNERHSGIASSTIEKSIRVDLSFRLLSLRLFLCAYEHLNLGDYKSYVYQIW